MSGRLNASGRNAADGIGAVAGGLRLLESLR